MALRYLMMMLMAGWLTACGQIGPLYLPEEAVVTDEIEVTETVTDATVEGADGQVEEVTAERVEVDAEQTGTPIEEVEEPLPPGTLGEGERPLGSGE